MSKYHTSTLATIHYWPNWQPIKLLSTHERWRRVAKILKVTKEAKARLDWVIYSRDGYTVTETCRHFGMTRKTFYKWTNVFNEDNLYTLYLMQDRSRAPKGTRKTSLTQTQELRIVGLRKTTKRVYGAKKLARLYRSTYHEYMSEWHVGTVIKAWKLYRNPKKKDRSVAKRARSRKHAKRKLIELKDLAWYQKKAGYIICLDTVTIYWSNLKRYFFTAIDKYGKAAYVRMYTTKSSRNAEDFLYRLRYLYGDVLRVGRDRGSEFEKHFTSACVKLGITQYYSRVHTPKDNAECERFNQTLQTEFLDLGNFSSDPAKQNRSLTEWLIEYNFRRPHETLNYQPPIQVTTSTKVSPMYPLCTRP